LYVLNDSIWGMKITALEESADFATLDTEKLFSKLKSHELSRKGHPNHDASFSSKALITGARVGGHVANPTNTTDSSALEFTLSSLCAASDEQYESDDSSSKGDDKKKYRFGDKKKKFQKMMSRVCVPSVTSTSPAMTPPAPRRMRGPSARQVTSQAFASWANRHGTSLTLTLM
jgi:hypothetical protein